MATKPCPPKERLSIRTKQQTVALLEACKYSEEDLATLAEEIRSREKYDILFELISQWPLRNIDYDWNVGSIARHFNADLVMDAVECMGDQSKFYEVSGLPWAIGESSKKNSRSIKFLQKLLQNAHGDNTRWATGLALEKLGDCDAVERMGQLIQKSGLQSQKWYWRNLHEKQSVVGLLVHARRKSTRNTVVDGLRTQLMARQGKEILIGCSWLALRLGIFEDELVQKISAASKHADFEVQFVAQKYLEEASLRTCIA